MCSVSLEGVYMCSVQLTKSDRGAHWRQASVETALFYTSKEVDHLIKEIEVRQHQTRIYISIQNLFIYLESIINLFICTNCFSNFEIVVFYAITVFDSRVIEEC